MDITHSISTYHVIMAAESIQGNIPYPYDFQVKGFPENILDQTPKLHDIYAHFNLRMI